MKKITIYISVLAGIVLFFSACELNDYPKFDDANAFVAFGSENMTVTEDAGTLEIPVRLTSLSGLSSTVSFDFIDSTAVKGRDYSLKGGASVLNFDGNEAVQNIEVDIVNHEGKFTGDMKFGVRITSSGSVNAGSIDTMWVTIADLDHPLAAILGEYTGSGDDAWGGGVYSWDGVVFEKDANDVTKVWIKNIFAGYSVTVSAYGIVNEDMTEITMPVHQAVGTISGYNAFFDGAAIPFALMEEGEKLTFTIDGNTVALQGDFQTGVTAYNASTGEMAGWFERVSKLTFVKK